MTRPDSVLPLAVHDRRAESRCGGCGVAPGRPHMKGCVFEPRVAKFCRRVWPFTEADRA